MYVILQQKELIISYNKTFNNGQMFLNIKH